MPCLRLLLDQHLPEPNIPGTLKTNIITQGTDLSPCHSMSHCGDGIRDVPLSSCFTPHLLFGTVAMQFNQYFIRSGDFSSSRVVQVPFGKLPEAPSHVGEEFYLCLATVPKRPDW